MTKGAGDTSRSTAPGRAELAASRIASPGIAVRPPEASEPVHRSRRSRGEQLAALRASKPGRMLLGSIGILVALLLWEGLVQGSVVPEEDIPAASTVIQTLAEMSVERSFWTAVGRTLLGAGIGLTIAVVIGIGLGLAMGSVHLIGRGLRPTVEFLRTVPGVALIPLSLLVFGQNMSSDVFLVAFGCVWPMLVQTIYGVQNVDDVSVQTARSFGISRLDRIRWVVVPATLPYVATGLRICASVALIIAVTAELVTGTPGLGSEILFFQGAGRVNEMYALILASGILGILIQSLFGLLERRVLHWHQSQRTVTA